MVVDAGDYLIAGWRSMLSPTSISVALQAGPARAILIRASALRRSTSAFRFATISASSPRSKDWMPVGDHRLAPGLGVGGDYHPLGRAVDAQGPRAPSPARISFAPSRSGLVAVADHFTEDDRLPSSSAKAANSPPASISPSWAGSPIRTSLASAASAWWISRARVAESTIPASSISRTELWGSARWPWPSARSSSPSRRAMLVASRPSARRTLAARQVGAAALSSIPPRAQPSAALRVA